jgi:hypothetical protein
MSDEVITALSNSLNMAFAMFWQILWALIAGFSPSALVPAAVSKSELSWPSPRQIP